MDKATFHFHGAANDFLQQGHRDTLFTHTFDWKASIKDMVESLGPPHTEIEVILMNGESVELDAIVLPDAHIEVYSHGETDTNDKIIITPPPPLPPRFILDTHLGRLANYLRMMGFDTLYRNDYPDDELAEVSNAEDRILLTRDIGVLKRSLVTYGHWMRETDPKRQIIEVMRRYDLTDHVVPFHRCIKCNGTLHAVDKDDIRDSIPENSATHYDEFHQCDSCEQVYWKGSHYEKMQAFMTELID